MDAPRGPVATRCSLPLGVAVLHHRVFDGYDMSLNGVAKILIANDNEWAARSLESILAPEGYEVVRVYTGDQAVTRAVELKPDLIILDMQLPDISGFEVCRTLRADCRVGWSTPIIVTTAAVGSRSRVQQAIEAGAWDLQTQPFDAPLFLRRVAVYLRAKTG